MTVGGQSLEGPFVGNAVMFAEPFVGYGTILWFNGDRAAVRSPECKSLLSIHRDMLRQCVDLEEAKLETEKTKKVLARC